MKIPYYRTKVGLISIKYGRQKSKCIKYGYPPQPYTVSELIEWAIAQPIFHTLYDAWVKSGYDKWLVPSFDRINDYEGYHFSNMQILTWRENSQKFRDNIMNGINNKQNKAVLQYTVDGKFVEMYHSMRHAERTTGIWHNDISNACSGKLNKAGGFIWKYY